MADIESNLTTAQIQHIHGQRTAVKDRFYTEESGTRYLGLADGRLQKIDTIKGDVTGDLEESVVSSVGGKTAKEIADSVDQTDENTEELIRLDNEKIDVCKSIAMSIALQ